MADVCLRADVRARLLPYRLVADLRRWRVPEHYNALVFLSHFDRFVWLNIRHRPHSSRVLTNATPGTLLLLVRYHHYQRPRLP